METIEIKVNELERKVDKIEFIIERQDIELSGLTAAIDNLAKATSETQEIQNKVKYWIQSAIFILVVKEIGLVGIFKGLVGI